MNEIIIDKNAKQITFTNNGIGFSQFGIADEVLDLIESQIKEIERLNNIIKEQGLEDKPNYYVKGLEGSLKEYQEEIERLNNIINKIEEHFVFLKMNSTGGNKEFFEDILDYIKALKELKGSDKH